MAYKTKISLNIYVLMVKSKLYLLYYVLWIHIFVVRRRNFAFLTIKLKLVSMCMCSHSVFFIFFSFAFVVDMKIEKENDFCYEFSLKSKSNSLSFVKSLENSYSPSVTQSTENRIIWTFFSLLFDLLLISK